MEERKTRALETIAEQLKELNRINSAWHDYEQQRQAKADELQQAILAPMMARAPQPAGPGPDIRSLPRRSRR